MSSSTKTGQKLRKRFKKELPFHLMLLPAVVMVVLFKYIPMAGLSIAFQDYSPLYSILSRNGADGKILSISFLFQHSQELFTTHCLLQL